MAVVEVASLRRSYGSFEALRGIDFSIEAGEIVGLLGPNGAGKSTTMKIITGFLAPTGGTAKVCGFDVVSQSLQVRERVGYLPESAPAYPEMTVGAWLDFIARVRGVSAAERTRSIERLAEECGLKDRMGQLIGTLSKGYKQRVGLAQALVHQPDLLVLDEPSSGLDPNQIVDIRSLIRRVGEKRTVILSTHILPEVQATCDRVIIIDQGRLVADGGVEKVVSAQSGEAYTVVLSTGKVTASASQVQGELGEVLGVSGVHPLASPEPEHLRFEVHARKDLRAELFRWAVDRGYVLLELTPRQSNLEEVFRSLTA